MIDIAHAKQEFEKYLDEYDREDEQIYLKIEHTYGVVKYAGEIAERMECSGEDVELAELIGLLHDIVLNRSGDFTVLSREPWIMQYSGQIFSLGRRR